MYRSNMKTIRSPEEGYIPPFQIADGLYFVGTYQSSSHMIDTGDGLILIDTGYANTADMVLSSVRALGFDPKGIKYIIHTHHHGDHVDATPAKVFTLDEMQEAHRFLESSHGFGKVVVTE